MDWPRAAAVALDGAVAGGSNRVPSLHPDHDSA
jgi:hypothetical protein